MHSGTKGGKNKIRVKFNFFSINFVLKFQKKIKLLENTNLFSAKLKEHPWILFTEHTQASII